MMGGHFDAKEFFREEDATAHDSSAAKPNGHDASPELRLIHFTEMQPRLSDGYLIKHLLGSTAMAVVFGESGSTKTYFSIYLGLCVAAGLEFFGRRVRQAGVVYVAAEAGRGIENRVVAARRELDLADMLPFAAVTAPIDLRKDEPDLGRLIDAVRDATLGAPVELIIIDTLSRVMGGGNENQPDDMGALVRNIDRLRAETGAAVVVVHHSGKDASRGARGHSLLRAATDTEIEVSRDDATKIATARVTKQREYPTDGTLTYSLRQVELGLDSDGDRVTSCVVEPSEAGIALPKKAAKLTGAAKVGYEQLKNCLADHSQEISPSKQIPKGAKGVTLDLWRGYLEKAGVINPKGNPREQFRRIRVTLQDRGYIGVWDDSVWLSHGVTGASQ